MRGTQQSGYQTELTDANREVAGACGASGPKLNYYLPGADKRVVTPVLACRDKVLRSLGKLPPFPPVLNRVLASMASEDVSFGAVSDLIEKDTVLAGNVLKIVNSALYGRRGTVNSVRHAVSLLGINKLRNAVLSMSIARMWASVKTPPGWSMTRFNLHSVAAGILCDLLAQQRRVEYGEGAFVAGLLHDVGLLLVAIALPDEYREVEQLYRGGYRSWCECETEVFGFTHPEISAEALSAWNLPEPIRAAVVEHHCTASFPGTAQLPEISLGMLLFAANGFVNSSGISVHTEFTDADRPDPQPFLTVAGERSAGIISAWQSEVKAVSAFF